MLRKTILLLHTMRHLNVRQIYYYILRRYLPPRYASISATPSLRESRSLAQPCKVSGIYVCDTTFRFLNTEFDLLIGDAALDWSAHCQSRLWQYNLHYFDFLRESERTEQNKDRLIDSWIDGNPQGCQPGWEPFTTSLRIVNWVFYMLHRTNKVIPPNWLDSLYLQALWLERNDEQHILANHYFENLKALFVAGCFFDSGDANRWMARTCKEIPRQIREQTLTDGGHYERSHLYHCLMLENYLDIYNFAQSHRALCPHDFSEQVRNGIVRATDWLAATLFPDGTIPLFNDSAFGVSIPPRELFLYAKRLDLAENHTTEKEPKLIDRPATGLYGCRVCNDMLIIDCGDIGPSYQPGHTHCDFLSYELMISGCRVIVDAGVCEYAPGPLRDYVRSTRAHNTVSVDRGEQSELWGEFRVARRAKKVDAEIKWNDGVVYFSGSYRGFHSISHRILHERTAIISLSADKTRIENLKITDNLGGIGHHSVESFIHFHPDIRVYPTNDREFQISHNNSMIASVRVSDCDNYRIESGLYCPEFGKQIPNQVLVLQTEGILPLSLCYELRINSFCDKSEAN